MTTMVVKDLASVIDICEEGEEWADAMRLLEYLDTKRFLLSDRLTTEQVNCCNGEITD